MLNRAKRTIKMLSTIHIPDGSPNVFLFSMPRSGSTWLMEIIFTQPGYRWSREPFNIRNPVVRDLLGISDWAEFYTPQGQAKVERYVQRIVAGKLNDYRLKYPTPFTSQYRPITHRILFKILHYGEERINWFKDTFNGRVVYLIRHPIPVSVSREGLPRLQTLVASSFLEHFTPDQQQFARQCLAQGSDYDHRILEWCLQNTLPLQSATPDWTIVTYEQLVVQPEPVLELLAQRLELPKPEKMYGQLKVESGSTKTHSDAATQDVLRQERTFETQRWLVEKWRKKVQPGQIERAAEILAVFKLDQYYQPGETFASPRLWIGDFPGS